MHRPHRTSYAKTWAIAALCLTFRLTAQQPAAPAMGPPQVSELEPLIVDDGMHHGEVVLTLALDSKGSVATATASAGGDLVPVAIANAKLFRHPGLPGASGLSQRVLFLRGKDVKTSPPEYPVPAINAHLSGTVRMVATVAPDGHVTDITILSGAPLLQNSARDSVLKWVFPPVQQGGSPVQCHAVVTINFAFQRPI